MTGTRFLHRIFRLCGRTHRLSREDTYENYFDYCSLPTRPYVYGLWAKWISQLHPPAAPGESTGDAVLCRRERIAFCRILFRAASARGGALQHPCVSLDAFAGDHCSGSGGLCTVGTGLPSVPRKLQGDLQREACDAAMNCVAVIAASRTA